MFSVFSSVFHPSNAFRNFAYRQPNKTHKKRPESASEKHIPLIMATNSPISQYKPMNRTKHKKVVAAIVETEPTTEEVAANIQRHRKKSRRNTSMANQLGKLCSQSGFCLAIGADQTKLINNFFKNFSTFEYLTEINKLSFSSNNGVVFEYVYKRASYEAFCIFKMSMRHMADNLMYEFWVGKFINKHIQQFPCFVETYGLYKFSGEDESDREKNYTLVLNNGVHQERLFEDFIPQLKSHRLFTMISDEPLSWDNACLHSKYFALLIQHIPITHSISATTLYNTKRETLDYANQVLSNDFLYILYQLYMPLSVLAEKFTHYDLHHGNVLLYKPDSNKYLEYNCHYADGTIVSFLSPFIVKIIDYGRCYVSNEDGDTSMDVYHALCSKEDSPNCNTNARYLCGDDKGFESMTMGNLEIESNKKNISQDLKFANYFKKRYNTLYAGKYIKGVHIKKCHEIINKIVYGIGVHLSESEYGTVENTEQLFPSRINNVYDMHHALKDAILDKKIIAANNKYYKGWSKLGTLSVYCDGMGRKMKWEPL